MDTRKRTLNCERPPSFTDLAARNNAGELVSFDAFTDKVVLAVNVARL